MAEANAVASVIFPGNLAREIYGYPPYPSVCGDRAVAQSDLGWPRYMLRAYAAAVISPPAYFAPSSYDGSQSLVPIAESFPVGVSSGVAYLVGRMLRWDLVGRDQFADPPRCKHTAPRDGPYR